MKIRTWAWAAALIACFTLYALFPEPAWAAEGGGERWGPWLLVGRVFNLAVVVLVLVWIARKPLSEFYASRTQSIREQLAEAEQARLEAEAKLTEVQSRMARLNDELAQMKDAAEREAREEYDRLMAEAERSAQKVVERARQEIGGMTRAAQNELRAHAAELTVRLAEEQIRSEIDDRDRARLTARFLEQLGDRR